jgi:hypothetical protein
MTTLSDLFTATTSAEELASILATLSGKDFPINDWEDGGVARTICEILAQAKSDWSTRDVKLTKTGFLRLCTGDAKTFVAKQLYDLDRYAATRAVGPYTLTCASGAGPYTILAGQIWVTDDDGHRFVNTAGGTLTSGGTLSFDIRAEYAGTSHNVLPNTITTMVTTLPGVTGTNPGTGSWPTTPGTNEESDALLEQRCLTQWATLGYGQNDDWYVYYCRTGHDYAASVTRVKVVTDPLGTGKVTVTVAGPAGGLSSAIVGVVDTWLRGKLANGVTLVVQSATEVTVSIVGDAYVLAANASTYLADAATDIVALTGTLEIGGLLYRSAEIEALMTPDGAQNVVLTSPTGDTTPASAAVIVPSLAGLTVHSV